MSPSALNEHGIRTFSGPSAWAGLAASSAAIVALGAILIVGIEQYVRSLDVLAATSPEAAIARAGTMLKVLGLVMGVLAIGTALYTARSCARVLAHRQLPPPGSWVLGGPKVIYGTRAVVWGRVGYALAGLLAILGGSFTYLIWQFVDLMMTGVAG